MTVAEIRREIVKQLGVNMSGTGPNGSFTLENPFAINGAVATSEGMLNWVKGGQSFSATLQAFERQGVAHTLAEPTVTAVSGESAKFLAGGTIPILNNVQCNPTCQYGFIQQPYGVTLNFTPVVLSQGRIQLRIATEVTDVDYATQITYSGISIPGFRTRNNTTTVELPSGGSIASAGLISTQTQQAVNGFPALMNVPMLGALFRSRDYQRNETELMIVVTPYIVHAIDPEPDRSAGPELPGRQRSANLVPRPRQPHLLHFGIASTDAGLCGQDRIHHPVDLAALRQNSLKNLRKTALMAALPDARRVFAARVLSLAFVVAAACGPERLRDATTRPRSRRFRATFRSAIRSLSLRLPRASTIFAGRRRARRALDREHPRLRPAVSPLRLRRHRNSRARRHERQFEGRSRGPDGARRRRRQRTASCSEPMRLPTKARPRRFAFHSSA